MDPAPNLGYLLSSRLGDDWSADRFQPKPELLAQLSTDAFESLDPLVKARLILSCLMAASRQQPRGAAAAAAAGAETGGLQSQQQQPGGGSQLAAQLRRLGDMALADDDAWVKVLGAAAGDFDGRLDLGAVCAANPKVNATVARLRELAAGCTNAHLYPPLEELYLAPSNAEAAAAQQQRQHHHFTPRAPGEVPALRVRARAPGPLSPKGLPRQGSMLARRGTSTGEDAAFRPARAAEAPPRAQQRAQQQPERRAGKHPVQPVGQREAVSRLSLQALAGNKDAAKLLRQQQKEKLLQQQQQQQEQQQQQQQALEPQQQAPAGGAAPKVRLPLQLKRTGGAAQPVQPRAPPPGPEEDEAGAEPVLGSSAARLASWDDDDDDDFEPARATAAAPRPALQIARGGRQPSGRLRAAAASGAVAADVSGEQRAAEEDALLEDDVAQGDGAEAPQSAARQLQEQQLRELFEDEDDEAEAGPTAGGASATGAAGVEAAAAGTPSAKAKRRRAVISDDDED
ncbi:hypothetical protein MNEG_3252 [Monoraphidium neglectum]|uniref:Uncharacterized protein n=1 Tax=Monoraphidium neglectum TaxID=145388 RepID=A0A0D2MPX6_9CHLO|nr:hypothetical protein MNEG_3252 [Monoraphidium neglectum]KIZ04705.1 hypothetical protein MNEG_3252 [Monoraphidium neglectum]|eukprot:XP_013903724.1 hypothetical protein MNEG_3252 [Monoraphidium neglectum]